MDNGKPPWDEAKASGLLGKYVLVGVTRVEANAKTLVSQDQYHGTISKVDPKDGFAIACKGTREGQIEWLPPDPSSFHEAVPGEYRLRSTGEVIVNPDFTSSWTITRSLK